MDDENNNESQDQPSEEGNKIKAEVKSTIRKKVTPWLLKIGVPVLLVLLTGALLFGVFNAVGDTVQNIIDSIVEFFTIDPGDGTITIDDNQVDTIINSIADLGVSIDGLKLMGDVNYDDPNVQAENQEALRKYIREFYEAQAVTQTLNTKPNWWEEHILNGGELYGAVYVHRTKGEEVVEATDENQLEYIKYEEMVKKQEKGDKNIIKYFTMDEEGKLVIPITTATETDKEITAVTLKHIDYKNAISQYTTSMNFFLYLAIITQNPEFASAVADLVKQSEIRLVVLDSEYTTEVEETYSYIENSVTATNEKVEKIGYDARGVPFPYTVEELVEGETTQNGPISTTTTTKTTTITPKLAITYVKTWFCEQTITYTKQTEGPNTTTNGPMPAGDDDPKPIINAEGTYTWKTNKTVTSTTTTTSKTYKETTRGDVIDRTGQKGDGKKSFIGLLDVEFKIPNTTRKVAAGGNLVSGAEMFFYLLQKDPASQNLEQIMRYILQKYTGDDYGVAELDFSIYNAKDFVNVSGSGISILKEYIHKWENAGGAPTNADGTKYIIQDDGAGHPTVGYGVDIYNSGYLSLFQQAGYPTEIGGEVDKEFVDAIEDQIIESSIDSIRATTAGLDLKEYQIHALVSRAYNCGTEGAISVKRGSPALNFVESYSQYWNPETDDLFEKQNNNANFGHSLYTQYMSEPVTSNGEYFAGLENRRKSEWTLFQTGYYDVLGKWHQAEGGDILEMCAIVMNDLLDHNVKYSISNLAWNDIEASNDFSKYGCCCATYVSVVLYRSGELNADFINQYNYNYTGTINGGGVNTMLKDAGWTHVSEAEAQAGDVCVYNGHTFIYAGGNEIWDQTSGCIGSSGEAPLRRYSFIMELL